MNFTALKAAAARWAGLIMAQLASKVDKVEGKQLSTEDFTSVEKAKLSDVRSMAMRDLHVSTEQPDNSVGQDGDIWLVIRPPQQ